MDWPTAAVVLSAILGAVAILVAGIWQWNSGEKKSGNGHAAHATAIIDATKIEGIKQFERLVISVDQLTNEQSVLRAALRDAESRYFASKQSHLDLLGKFEERAEIRYDKLDHLIRELLNAASHPKP